MARHGLAHIEDRRDIGPEQAFKRILGKILERSAMLHACIVDKDIDRSGIALETVDG